MPTVEEVRWNWILLRYVRPFYLKAGWVPEDSALRKRFLRAGRRVELRDVRRMLHEGWRETSVAAWYCLRFPADMVSDDLEAAIGKASSARNVPMLAASCVALLGPRAATMLQSAPCLGDAERDGQAARVVAAAIEQIGGVPPIAIDDDDRDWFQQLLSAATDFQQAYRQRPS